MIQTTLPGEELHIKKTKENLITLWSLLRSDFLEFLQSPLPRCTWWDSRQWGHCSEGDFSICFALLPLVGWISTLIGTWFCGQGGAFLRKLLASGGMRAQQFGFGFCVIKSPIGWKFYAAACWNRFADSVGWLCMVCDIVKRMNAWEAWERHDATCLELPTSPAILITREFNKLELKCTRKDFLLHFISINLTTHFPRFTQIIAVRRDTMSQVREGKRKCLENFSTFWHEHRTQRESKRKAEGISQIIAPPTGWEHSSETFVLLLTQTNLISSCAHFGWSFLISLSARKAQWCQFS